MADPYDQAFAQLQQALVDLDGDGRPDVAIGIQQAPTRGVQGATGEMRSYTPTMGQRISSALGSYYGPRAEQAADLLGLTMPYEGGRAAAEGVAGGDTAQALKGAALLALSPVPGLAAGIARSKAVPMAAEPVVREANSLVDLFKAGRADLGDRTALQSIKGELDALPQGTMRAPASGAATLGSAAAGGAIAGASAPFDPQSYEDWTRVALGAMGGAAAERAGAHIGRAPSVSQQLMAIDVPRIDATRAMTDAALATKQGLTSGMPSNGPRPSAAKFVPTPGSPGGAGSPPGAGAALPPPAPRGGGPVPQPTSKQQPPLGSEPTTAPSPKSDSSRSPLTNADRLDIQEKLLKGKSPSDIATEYGVKESSLRGIVKDTDGFLKEAGGDKAKALKALNSYRKYRDYSYAAPAAVGAGAAAQEDNPLLSLWGP